MFKVRGAKVPPRSRIKVRLIAQRVRELINATAPRVDVIRLLEVDLAKYGVEFHVATRDELGEDHGRTTPDDGLIQIREDVYKGAHKGVGRDRFTICHEVGHVVMHHGIGLPRVEVGTKNANWKPYEDSEWQADNFAAEFLMPVEHVNEQCSCAEDIEQLFGVSYDAADVRIKVMKQGGVLQMKRRT